MRFLLVLIVVAFAGCGGPSDESEVPEEMETAADGLQESLDTTIQKAEDVEDALQEAADELDAAIDEASGEN
ncbi:MAG: hypothetical protein ACR2QT_12355 [Woeseiaceae bacterium]